MKLLDHVALIMMLAAPGCTSTGVGNPGDKMTVTVVNDLTAEPQATDPGVQLAVAQVRHAVLAFGELRFVPCDLNDGDVVVPGPIVVNLVTSKVEPALPTIAFPPGGFCGLDAPLTTAAPSAAMQGRSIFFSGLRDDGTLFLLYADMPGTLHMRPDPADVVWDASNASSMIWALRPRRWLAPAELDAEPTDPLGTVLRIIVIDVNRHPVLFDLIRSRIGARSTLHTDFNGDHLLDDNDRVNGLIGEGLPSLD